MSGLIGCVLCLAAAGLAPGPAQEARDDDLQTIRDEFFGEVRKAYQDERPVNEDLAFECIDRVFAVADVAETPGEAVDALSFIFTILNYANNEDTRKAFHEALGLMIQQYLDRPAMARVVLALDRPPEKLEESTAAYLEEIRTETQCPDVKAAFVFVEAEKIMEKQAFGNPLAAGERATVLDLLRRLQTEYKDIEDPYGRGTLGEIAANMQFELENLTVGKEAPDIEGPDLDGVEFKLSDYRGKVVLLDFWGHW